jgi:NAD(P)-dependent dehydrogenase (short-subunit alcohol dehydrogenase family)
MSQAVLITGCSSGIGRETALALVRAGFPTWASARDPDDIADLAEAGCRVLQLDVTDEESRLRAVQAVEAAHGTVGALVNNAGYSCVGAIEELPLATLQQQFDTNLFGLMRMCQLVLPGMRTQGAGTIVNMGSAAGLITPPASGAYSMTKHALEALSDALRFEVHQFGVRVVLLQPGAVRTRLIANIIPVARDAASPYDKLMTNTFALAEREGPRGLPAEDVAKVVVRAIRSRRPRTRYRLGTQARLAPAIRRALGDRRWDTLLRRMCPTD